MPSEGQLSPVAWVRRIRARPEYVGLLRVLVDHADRDGLVNVRIHQLTSVLDLTESPLKKMLAHLASLGFFRRESTAGPHGRQVLWLALASDPDELSDKIQDSPTHRERPASGANHSHTATVSDAEDDPETVAIRPRFIGAAAGSTGTRNKGHTATVLSTSKNGLDANHSHTATVSDVSTTINHGQTATVAGPNVSPTPPSEVSSTGTTTSTSVDVDGNTPRGIPGARAKAPKKKFERGQLKLVTAEVREKMVDRWAGPLGGADVVNDTIDLLLSGKWAEDYTDLPMYVNNNLRREADRRAAYRGRNGNHVAPAPSTVDSEFARFNRSGSSQRMNQP